MSGTMSSGSIEADDSLGTEDGVTDEEDSSFIDDYYAVENTDVDCAFESKELDPEYFGFCLISREDAENMLDSVVEEAARKLKVS